MIWLNRHLVNPAHIIAIKADGEAALTVYVSSPIGELSVTCDSPDDAASLREEIVEAVSNSQAGNR